MPNKGGKKKTSSKVSYGKKPVSGKGKTMSAKRKMPKPKY